MSRNVFSPIVNSKSARVYKLRRNPGDALIHYVESVPKLRIIWLEGDEFLVLFRVRIRSLATEI